jgi:DNA-binding response OmpR family regulator
MAAALILIAGIPAPTRHTLARILTRGGYDVRECLPEELPEAAPPLNPDLIIIQDDPERVGPALQALRLREAARVTPVIVAPTDFSDSATARVLELGADEFLLPPFKTQEVLARVAVLLRLQQDRALLLASQAEFSRTFAETSHPLFFCDRAGSSCQLNPALRRFLGYPAKREAQLPLTLDQVFYSPEDQTRFRQLVGQAPGSSHVKIQLRSREGLPVTVLLQDLALPDRPRELVSFEVKPVGAPSPLKRALKGLVQHLLPGARDWLALLQLTPLLGGRYEQVKKLGQGNFGEVWLVLDTEAMGPGRHYVAKIPFSRAANPKVRKEAAICRKLAPYPGLVGLVATLEEEGKLVLIQDYVEGRTLGEMLGEELPRPLVERLILQLIEVVAHAHRHRVIHRDIKPNNIIIQPDGTLTLLDFGAAKMLGDKDISATMTGSRPFMAPEQIMGKSERRSDIWAIGVLMYLLYTGELPFYSEVEKLLIDQILEQEPLPPREENPEIPPALETIILKCLKKKVEERYPQAMALKADLLQHFPHYGTQAGRWPWLH